MDELDCRGIEERLPWLLNGSLPPDEGREVEAHLAGCAACGAALAATRRASALFAAHPDAGALVDYAFGIAIEREMRAALELHFAHCGDCREELRLVEAEREATMAGLAGGSGVASIAPPPVRRPRAFSAVVRPLALAAAIAVASGLAVFVSMRGRAIPESGSVALVELVPQSTRTRGGEAEEISIRSAVPATLLLVTDRAESFDDVRARIRPRSGGAAGLEESGLLPALGGGYALFLQAGALPAGAHEIELEGRLAGAWSPIGRYSLRVEP